MRAAKDLGRLLGALILAQAIIGGLVNLALLRPVFALPGGFLENAAAHSLQVSMAMLLGLLSGAMSIGSGLSALPVFRQHSSAAAYGFLAFGIVNMALTAVENITVFALLAVSQAYLGAQSADAESLRTLGVLAAGLRNGAHYINLTLAGAMLLVLYGTLFRYRLVPRALAAFGLVAVLLQIGSVTQPLFGQRVQFLMIMPLGLSQLLLGFWLIAQGLAQSTTPTRQPQDPSYPS